LTSALERDKGLAWAYFNRSLSLLLKGEDARAQNDRAICLELRPDLKEELDRRIRIAKTIRAQHVTVRD
jgi:hypothetical protein